MKKSVLLFIALFSFTIHTADAAFVTHTTRFYSLSGDGNMYSAPLPSSWATQRANTVGIADSTHTRMDPRVSAYNSSVGNTQMVRGFFAFDTSAIPDDAVIVDATTNFYVVEKEDSFDDQYAYFNIHEGRQTSPFTLEGTDIDRCGNAETNPIKGSVDMDITNVLTGQYVVFPLNTTGQGWVSKNGYTKLCTLEGHDAENVQPIWNGNTWKQSYLAFNTSEVLGTETDPYLEVTYTLLENTNQAPTLTPIGNQVVNEGDTLSFTIFATDPDNDTLTYSAANLPAGAIFNPSTQTFSWTPEYSDEGNYTDVEFTVTDDGTPMELAVELITITVGNVNRAPVLSNPGPQEVLENEPLTFSLSATDPDGDAVSITATNLPTGATFNGTTFTWTPTLSQEGTYTVSFTATDNGAPNESTLVEVVITVGDNPTPVEQAEDLVDTVVDLNLPQNVENSYLANLQKVSQFITDGKIQAALNQLQAFMNKVQTSYQQGDITLQVRNALFEMAEGLANDLE